MTMSFQAHDGHIARSEELHRHILRSHLAYLNQEETPSKLEQRRNLESFISEFLCVVTHSTKFTFIEVSNILHYSVENNPNFSAYKAQSAFEALEKYATNLISHPWRKEYKTVKLYSGFYKHSVENQLLHADSVFQLLGYQSTEDGVLYLDEPVDPDKVARVALDCLTAFVECQMMVQICERVKSYKCSWPEIHGIREDYVCGIDEAVRLLHQLKRNALEQDKQNHWLRNQENGFSRVDKNESSSNYPKTGILVDVSNTWPSDDKLVGYDSVRHSSISEEPLKTNKSSLSHSKLSSWSDDVNSHLDDYHSHNVTSKSNKSDSFTNHNFDDHNQASYNFLKSINPVSRHTSSSMLPDCWNNSWDLIHSPLQPASYHRNDSYQNCDLDSHRTGYNQTVPNVKEPYSSQYRHVFPPPPIMPIGIPGFPYAIPHDFSVPPRQCQSRLCCENQLPVITHKYQPKDNVSDTFESNSRPLGRHETNHRYDADISAPFNKMAIDHSSLKSRSFPVNSPVFSSYQTASESANDVILRADSEKLQHNNSKRGSYYDNVPSTFENDANTRVVGQSLNSKCDFQSNGIGATNSLTLGKSRSHKGTLVSDSASNSHSLKLQRKSSGPATLDSGLEKMDTTSAALISDSKNIKPNQTAMSKDSKGKKWSCISCTFYNAANKNICDMCGRSKLPGPEVTPLVSGGRECPQCTLVNKKDSENCTACGASLKDSPTYI